MGKDFKYHCAFLEEKLHILWYLNVIIIKGGAYITAGQSLGYSRCSPILSIGGSTPGRSYWEAGAVFGRNPGCAAPSAFSPALPGRARSPAGTRTVHPYVRSSGGKQGSTQSSGTTAAIPASPLLPHLAALGGFSSLSQISFQLARTVFERHGELQEDFREKKKKSEHRPFAA